MAQRTRRRFTSAQRQAYQSGKGYAVGFNKKGINFSKPEVRASFQAGYSRGLKMMAKNPLKYPTIAKKRKKKS